MTIPKVLLKKIDKAAFRGKIQRILEEGWNYFNNYFNNEEDYFNFLINLSKDNYEKLLYTVFFYWAHDLYRIVKEKSAGPNLDGFMYQITLSIIEYLNKPISTISKVRIKYFFTKYFSNPNKNKLKDGIKAVHVKNGPPSKVESWEILYDMRNKFIHGVGWFTMKLDGAFASLSVINERKDGIEYIADIRIQYKGYLKLFWEAYLNYFGYNRP